jgi:hypothetical protein
MPNQYPKHVREGFKHKHVANPRKGEFTGKNKQNLSSHDKIAIPSKKDHNVKNYMAKKGPYMMSPGSHSEVNPGNFKGSEVMKYSALNAHPMKFPDLTGDGKVTQADVLKGRGVFNMVDGKSHADLKAAGGKAFDIHMRDHNKNVFMDKPQKNQHLIDARKNKPKPGESMTEYRNRISGKPTEFSRKLIQEYKDSKTKNKVKKHH